MACSLAAHYDKQQEQTEDKPHKGKPFNVSIFDSLWMCVKELAVFKVASEENNEILTFTTEKIFFF